MSSNRIVTDNPTMTGYLDGVKAVDGGSRTSRIDAVPEGQRDAYQSGFRDGAKDAAK